MILVANVGLNDQVGASLRLGRVSPYQFLIATGVGRATLCGAANSMPFIIGACAGPRGLLLLSCGLVVRDGRLGFADYDSCVATSTALGMIKQRQNQDEDVRGRVVGLTGR